VNLRVFKKFDESEFLLEVSNIAYKLSTMSWCLDKVGGTFESRLKEAEKNSIVDETELVKIRTLESISNTIHRNLSKFIGKLETAQKVLNSARLKNIKINITVINSATFVENKCIAWIKKANTNCYGQCCKKLREGRFCGFHRASKSHLKPITTIYDHKHLHILYEKSLHLKLLSSNTNIYAISDLSNCYQIYWKELDIFVNPMSKKMFCRLGSEIECVGYTHQDDDTIYNNYLSKINKI